MDQLKRKAGQPRKPTEEKSVKLCVSIDYPNYSYIVSIIEARKLERKGNFSTILNELVGDHKQVRSFKQRQTDKLRGKLAEWGE